MKILLLIDKMDIGGAETHVLSLAEALIKDGYGVDLMCGGGAYTKALSDMGVHVYAAPFHKRSVFSFIRACKALRKIKENGYNAVHAHTRYTAVLASLFLPRIPLVTTVHLDFSLSFFYKQTARWGRKSLAVSKDLAEYLMRGYGIRREDILITKNGINTKEFSFLSQTGKEILHISRLDRDRSLAARMLCGIAPKIYAQHPEIRIRIYGDGDDLEQVMKVADQANKATGRQVVFLMGKTERPSEVLASAGIFVGVSRAALEACARGIPTVLAGNDGYGGILTEERFEARRYDNFCCRGCKKAEEEALLSDILFLLEHRCFCENQRQRIARQIDEEYSAEGMARDAGRAYRAAQRIGIIGYYGYGNFGDEMMLSSLRKRLSEAGYTDVLHLSKDRGSGVISRKTPLRTALYLRRCDTVFFGGGNLLQSETSLLSFFYYAALILFCKGGTLHGIGMGLGDFRGRTAERLAGRLLSRFSSLSMRTEADALYARRIYSDASQLHATCDPCLFLGEIEKKGEGSYILALPKRSMSDAMLAFLGKKRAQGFSVTVCALFAEEDLKGAKIAAKRLHADLATISDEKDFFTLAKNASLCISERLHGGIFSLLSHTPCLLYGGSKKNRAFAADTEAIAKKLSLQSPILLYESENDCFEKEKEAEGSSLGFSEIIDTFRNRYVDY